MEQPLADFLAQHRQKFREQSEKALVEHRRQADVRRAFELSCRRHFPSLRLVWLKASIGQTKKLLATYPGEVLLAMMDRYPQHPPYHANGVSFSDFYKQAPRIAADLAAAKKREVVVAERKQVAEAPPVSDDEMHKFRQSDFYKHLPSSIRDKLGGGGLTSGTSSGTSDGGPHHVTQDPGSQTHGRGRNGGPRSGD